MSESLPKKPRGFAALTTERRRDIARLGGIAAHVQGTAHQWTPEEARAAGKKGGAATHRNRPESLMSRLLASAKHYV